MVDVKINGVGYQLAEDAEGEHYSLSAEPLRPPNAVTVQGEDSQKFQMRPDTLLWSLTDWSGGEGQNKFDWQNGNRWRELDAVRAFDQPGRLSPGWPVITGTLGGSTATLDGGLARGAFQTWLFASAGPDVYRIDNDGALGGPYTFTGPTNGGGVSTAADFGYVYWHELTTNNVWKWDMNVFGLTPTQIDSGAMPATSDPALAELGAYVYVYIPVEGKIWELPKTGTPGDVLIDDFSVDKSSGVTGDYALAVMNNKIYALTNQITYSTVREITPTSAAGPGHGAEIARLHGVLSYAMWAHGGVLYVLGRTGDTDEIAVFYLEPGGSYGSLGAVRTVGATAFGTGGTYNSDMLQHFFILNSGGFHKVFQVDAVTGNVAVIASVSSPGPLGGMVYRGSKGGHWTTDNGGVSGRRLLYADSKKYTPSSYAISPWNDFALADEKILSSLVLSMEALPADWQVRVDYALDGTDTWTNAIDVTATNSKGTKVFVSSDASTVKFRQLSIRIRMDYTGLDDPPTTGPSILGVDALAMVAKPTKVWRLLLDLSDGKSRDNPTSGARKAANLEAATETEAVVSFQDFYGSSTPGVAVEHDVIIDSYTLVRSSPGEGVAAVTLKEVA
jgi:hypothetical protein